MNIGFDDEKRIVDLESLSVNTEWNQLDPSQYTVKFLFSTSLGSEYPGSSINMMLFDESNNEYSDIQASGITQLTLHYNTQYSLWAVQLANGYSGPSCTISVDNAGQISYTGFVVQQSNKYYILTKDSEYTYARYDSSIQNLEFMKSTESYNNGQVDGNYTYYTGVLNTSTTLSQIPWYSKRASIKSVTFSTAIQPTSTAEWFNEATNLTTINSISNLNTSNVVNMKEMFASCKNLTSVNLTGFNTAKVTDMYRMFYFCEKLTSINCSSFNTANVTSMWGMFDNCISATTITLPSNINTAKVTNMRWMFSNCKLLTAINNFTKLNTSNVTDMTGFCNGCVKITGFNCSSFNTAKVTSMESMFAGCSGATSINVSSFNTAKVTTMKSMFLNCSKVTSLDLSSFTIPVLKDTSSMFSGCSALTTVYSGINWSVSSTLDSYTSMFAGCTKIKNWNSNYTGKTNAHPNAAETRTDIVNQTKKPAESTYNSVKSGFGTGSYYTYRYGTYNNKYYIYGGYYHDNGYGDGGGTTQRKKLWEWNGSSWNVVAEYYYRYSDRSGKETETTTFNATTTAIMNSVISQNKTYAGLPAAIGGTAQTTVVKPAGYFIKK